MNQVQHTWDIVQLSGFANPDIGRLNKLDYEAGFQLVYPTLGSHIQPLVCEHVKEVGLLIMMDIRITKKVLGMWECSVLGTVKSPICCSEK